MPPSVHTHAVACALTAAATSIGPFTREPVRHDIFKEYER